MWFELCMSPIISLKTMKFKARFHYKTYSRAVINIWSSTVERVKTELLSKVRRNGRRSEACAIEACALARSSSHGAQSEGGRGSLSESAAKEEFSSAEERISVTTTSFRLFRNYEVNFDILDQISCATSESLTTKHLKWTLKPLSLLKVRKIKIFWLHNRLET